jgi:hypothetical protein
MRLALIFLSLSFSVNIFSQGIRTANQLSLNLLSPSVEYEIAVSNRSTIDADLGLGFTYHKALGESSYGIYPGFELQYRYYYNFEKRYDKGRKTSENSANYLAGVGSVTGGKPIFGDLEYESDYGVFIGPAWGLQRVYSSGFKLNLNLGFGYGLNDIGDGYFSPLFGLQLGWLILN